MSGPNPRMAALVVAAIVVFSCSSGSTSPSTISGSPSEEPAGADAAYESALELFEYDRARPFGLEEIRTEIEGSIAIRDIRYRQLDGRYTYAVLVEPSGPGPFGAVMYLHGAGGSPRNWLDEAKQVAGRGIVSLLVSAPEADVRGDDATPWRTAIEFEIRELRRALDLLVSRPNVDRARIGFVAHSFGAVRGATFAGVEGKRLKTAVLMCFNPRYGGEEMAAFDPITWLPRAAPAALFIQLGRQDPWYGLSDGEAMLAAARDPKRLVWYDAGHGLDAAAAADREAWLAQYLG